MASFLNDLPEKILSAIKFDNQKAKESNGKLHGLECPVCQKKEAWVYEDGHHIAQYVLNKTFIQADLFEGGSHEN